MVDYQIACFKTWAGIKNIELISFDDISENAEDVSNRLATHFCLPNDEDVILELLQNKSASIWEFNKGISDRWINEFTDIDKEIWKNKVEDFYFFVDNIVRGVR